MSAGAILLAAALALAAPTLAERAPAGEAAGAASPAETVVRALARSGEHGTPVAAIRAAALEETPGGAGPFTLFAPTDAACARLPEATVDGQLKPETRQRPPPSSPLSAWAGSRFPQPSWSARLRGAAGHS